MELDQSAAKLCENRLYRPDTLTSPYVSGHLRVRDINFRNVSFSRTKVAGSEFTNCTFERCLFLSTTFQDCRFTSCSFVDCNPHRAEFERCYVDPSSFDGCIPDRRYSNIGVYLFQELLRNSRQQAQPDFSDEAQYRFRKWQRYQLREELRKRRAHSPIWSTRLRLLRLIAFELVSGSGMRLGRLVGFAFSTLLLFTITNWLLSVQFGLMLRGKCIGFVDAFYFSTVIITTVGFGDITPATALGRIAVSCEAIIGFVLFAMVTSTIYRKFTS